MVCINGTCGCPEPVILLAIIGSIVIYALLALLVSYISCGLIGKKYSELTHEQQTLVILSSVFFPIAIPMFLIGFVALWLAKLILLPFTAVEKRDLRILEARLTEKIENRNNPVKLVKAKFKVGDLITGIKGNPDDYQHLNEGCSCRVKSINDKGIMKLILVDHKDYNRHLNVIGKEFTAPERNFKKK